MNIVFLRVLPSIVSLLVLAIAALSAHPAAAQNDPTPSTCQIKAKSMALPETIVGQVQSVQGSVLLVKLDNQMLRRVVVPDAEGIDLGFLQGQRVVIQQQACYVPPTPPIPQGW
jgi:lipopolysaccharide export system protein LptA